MTDTQYKTTAGVDIGYSSVKAKSPNHQAIFPSVVGTPDRSRFSLNGSETIILEEPQNVQVGQGAIDQSRYISRKEDRAWTRGPEWYNLFLASLSEIIKTSNVGLTLVTGLPVAFYDDKDALKQILLAEHTVKRAERARQRFIVQDVRIVPQPFGTLLSACITDGGVMHTEPGLTGVIDIGGKTTNLLSSDGFSEISRETSSVSVGAWTAARAVRAYLTDACPDLDLRDHQISQAIIAREVQYYGQPVDLSNMVNEVLTSMAKQIIAEAGQLWGGGASFERILITGGGALLLGEKVKAHFPHGVVVENPTWANALGYWRFARYVERMKNG